MAASSGDAHPYPIFNARYRVSFPIVDNTGALVTGAASLDSEASQDSGTYADCTNEATEKATNSGTYYLDLIATEMDTQETSVIVKTSTTNALTTYLSLFPVRLPQIRTGTAAAGANSTITIDGTAMQTNYWKGCYVNITNNTPSNALGQARKVLSSAANVLTIEGTWGTNPSSSSTYEILATEDWPYRLPGGLIDGLTIPQILGMVAACFAGKVAVTDNGDGTKTLSFKQQDGTTEQLSVPITTATGARASTGTIASPSSPF